MPETMFMTLEICVDRIESARAAIAGGAGRLEVCGSLAEGGITPGYGLISGCLALGSVEVVMMVRPHGGGFCCSADDLDAMLRDIGLAKQLGVRGVVLGALRADGRIDIDHCRRLIDAARPLTVTFHRAFDVTPDPLEALETLLDLQVDRLLTSGQSPSASGGAEVIRRLVQRAGGALSVMAGGGIRAEGLADLIRHTGVREIHASASEVTAGEFCQAGGLVSSARITRRETVRALAGVLAEFRGHDGVT